MKKVDVLIVSMEDDYHAIGVANSVRKLGKSCVILDNSNFPDKMVLIHETHDGDSIIYSDDKHDYLVDLNDLLGVWWRRPQPHKVGLASKHPSLKNFAKGEAREAFLGTCQASVKNFINPIGASRQASNKPYQLSIAKECGLNVPHTLITNDQTRVVSFSKKIDSEIIYKTFKGSEFGFYETRILNDKDLEDIDRISFSPTIFQEHIEGDLDIRVTSVESKLYSAEIHFKKGRHGVDGRIDRVPIKPHTLPKDVEKKTLNFVKRMGLRYAAIDFRIGRDGEYYFFEVNPEGQFLWVDIEAKLGICDSLAKTLVGDGDQVTI